MANKTAWCQTVSDISAMIETALRIRERKRGTLIARDTLIVTGIR